MGWSTRYCMKMMGSPAKPGRHGDFSGKNWWFYGDFMVIPSKKKSSRLFNHCGIRHIGSSPWVWTCGLIGINHGILMDLPLSNQTFQSAHTHTHTCAFNGNPCLMGQSSTKSLIFQHVMSDSQRLRLNHQLQLTAHDVASDRLFAICPSFQPYWTNPGQ